MFNVSSTEIFDILTHKTVSKDFKKSNWVDLNLKITAESMSDSQLWELGESKLGRLVDALALGGDEGRDKLR